MAGFIDRNAGQMMNYATQAGNVIDDMTLIIRKVESLLDSYAADLDDPTNKQIDKLHECCNEYFKQMEVYRTIADTIYQKGKKLDEIRNGG